MARRLSHRSDAVLLAVLAIATVAWIVLAADASYIFDDFIYFRASSVNGLTGSWLDSVWFQHWAPLHRLTFWGLERFFGLHWAPGFVLMLGFLLAATTFLWLVLRELFGPRPALHGGLVALFALSIMHVPQFQWASAGFQVLPDMACSLGALWAFLRFRATHRRPWALAAGAFTTVGLGFYVRPVLIPLWCALVWLAFAAPDLRPRALLRTLRADWLVWVCLLVPVGLYLWHYQHDNIAGETVAPTLDQIGDYVRTAWLRGFTPSWVLGVQIPQADVPGAKGFAVVLSQVLVAGAVVWSLARDRAAWRAWALLVIGFVATIGLVAAGRLSSLGPSIGYDLRYLSDLAWLFPLALAGAFRPRPAAARSPRARLLVAAGAAALAVHCVLAFDEAQTMRRAWPSDGAKRYIANLQTGIERAQRRQPGPLPLLDGIVPESVIFGNSPPYNRYSSVVPLFDRDIDFSGATATEYAVDADGHVAPVTFQTIAEVPLATLQTTGAASPLGAARCATGGTTYFERHLAAPSTPGGDLAFRIQAAGPIAGPAPIFVDQGAGYPAQTPVAAGLDPRRPTVVALDATTLSGYRFDVPGGACLARVTLGRLVRGSPL